MAICVIAEMTPEQVRQRVTGFARRYVDDWEEWLSASAADRTTTFGRILRKWQATRPYTMRKTQGEGKHGPPFLEDLIAQAGPYLDLVRGWTMRGFCDIGPPEEAAMRELWTVFRRLSLERPASCVGISKAVLLLTKGRIGPSLDSRVRAALGIERVEGARDWVAVLVGVSQDIRAYEQRNGVSLRETVPEAFRHLEEGRLCDMMFGPRQRRS